MHYVIGIVPCSSVDWNINHKKKKQHANTPGSPQRKFSCVHLHVLQLLTWIWFPVHQPQKTPNHHVLTLQRKAWEQHRRTWHLVCVSAFMLAVSPYTSVSCRLQEVSIRTFLSWLMCGIGGEVPGRLCVTLIFSVGVYYYYSCRFLLASLLLLCTFGSFMFVSCVRGAFEVSQ